MSKKSEAYWREREERQRQADLKSELTQQQKIDALGETLIKEINSQLDSFYMKYARSNGLTMAEVKKLADNEDIEEYARKTAKFAAEADFSKEAIKCIDQFELTAKSSRLELLMASINAEMANTTAETQKIINDALSGRALEEIERQASVYGKTVYSVGTRVQTLVNASFQNATWSSRLWKNQDSLRKTVSKSMRNYLVKGIATNTMMDEVKKELNSSVSNSTYCARRILVTERQRVAGQAQMESYRAAGLEWYQFVAEPGCCETCAGLDGKKFKIDDAEPAVNLRPIHPNCRCQTLGANPGSDEDFDEWLDSYSEHGMDFNEWLKMKSDPAYSEWLKTQSEHGLDFETYKKQYATGEDTSQFDLWTNTKYKHGLGFTEWMDEVAKAEKKVNTAQKYLDNFKTKTYANIWKEAVTEADYGEKKDEIQVKLSYFQNQLEYAYDDYEKDKWHSLIDLTEEFQKNGKRYLSGQTRLKNAQAQLKRLTSYIDMSNVFPQERKDNALWSQSPQEADSHLRSVCGKVWKSLTGREKQALYDYTAASGRFNRPLSGFEKVYGGFGSGWEPEYKKGVKKVWIDHESAGDKIRAMTDAISKSSYTEDIWLQRGCGYEAMESFFDLDFGTLSSYSQSDYDDLVGTMGRIYSFTSCGDSKGKGLDGDVILNIFCPAGTNMMYAEPFSRYGNGDGESWDGENTQCSFGSESEVIIQRGAKYKVVKIEKTRGTVYMDLEVHPEEGYDLYQQNDSEWTGKREKGR